MSFNSAKIPLERHIHWYNNVLQSSSHYGVFGLCANKNFGVVFCNVIGESGKISINVNPEFRKQKLSLYFLNLSLQFFTEKLVSLKAFEAQILKHNIESLVIFRKAGFDIHQKHVRSYDCRKLIQR